MIDVGCGSGTMVGHLSQDYRTIGVDPSGDSIALARERWPNLRFHQATATDVADDPTFPRPDAWLLMDVLEHVKDDQAVVSGLIRSLKPGGFLFITVPADLRLWSVHDEILGHYRRYDLSSLSSLWTSEPVKPRLVSHFNHRLLPIVYAVRKLKNWIPGDAIAEDVLLAPRPLNPVLFRVFSGERKRLVRALLSGSPGYSTGASLLAILQRVDAPVHTEG